MTAAARHPGGTRDGGRFAPGLRTEPSLVLGANALGFHRRYTESGMSSREQRELSRRLIRGVHESGVLARMVGSKNMAAAHDVLVAAADDARLDAAIHAIVTRERLNEGSTPPDRIGYELCRRLLGTRTPAALSR